MKLKSIKASNFKGLSFSLDLASINFLVGSNFAGKSARTDAIRLLLLGYLPELGKTPRAAFALASGKEMEVCGVFDDGSEIKRVWTLKGDAVKSEVFLDGPCEDWAQEGLENLAVMLNAETYFALSDRERVNYVFANVRMEKSETAISVLSATNAVLSRTYTNEQTRSLIVALGKISAPTTQEFIEHAIENAAEIAKGAKAYAATMEKTAQGVAGLRAADAPTINLSALDVERDALVIEIQRIEGDKAKWKAAFDAGRAAKARRDVLLREVGRKTGIESTRDSVSNTLDAKKHELEAIPVVAAEEVSRLQSEERDAAVAVADLNAQIRQNEEAFKRNQEELLGINAKEKCPYCGAAGDGWKALKAAEIDSALAGLNAKLGQLREHRERVKETADALLVRLREAQRHRSSRGDAESSISHLSANLERIEGELAVFAAKEAEIANLAAEDPAVVAAVETAQSSLNVANDALRNLDARRKVASGRDNDLRRLAEAEKARDAARTDEAVAKAAVEVLREIQRSMVAAAFEPLLATANSFFASILNTPLAYNDGEIGTWRGGVWVGHRTFSGTEKALCYAAIQMALASTSPVRIMIIDELGRLDDFNAGAVQAAVVRAIKEGRVDQFVGIDAGRADNYRTMGDSTSQVVEIA